jgi:hypothetical protein
VYVVVAVAVTVSVAVILVVALTSPGIHPANSLSVATHTSTASQTRCQSPNSHLES